jgi:26S proteasome regulatory subunit N2
MATGLTSASGLLALLEESEPKLKVYALEKLDNIVDEFWPEISDNIQQMYALTHPILACILHWIWWAEIWGGGESSILNVPCACSEVLNESESFEARELAALVASKVYYHIGSFKSAMIYALSAGKLFNIEEDSEFVRTLTCT